MQLFRNYSHSYSHTHFAEEAILYLGNLSHLTIKMIKRF